MKIFGTRFAVGIICVVFSLVAIPFVGTKTAAGAGPDPAGTIYVADDVQNAIDVFAAGATGNISPIRRIIGPSTGLSQPGDIAVDPSGDIYSSNFSANSITEYAPGASGNASPIRTIAGSNTDLNRNDDIALASDGTLYVGNTASSSVAVFAPGASGNVAPLRLISGALTGLSGGDVDGVGIDATGTLYADNQSTNSIQVFAPGANGNVAPTRTISGVLTGLNEPDDVKVGFGGNLLVSNRGGSLEEFAAGASGNVAPVRLISGGLTGFNNTDDLAVDANGNAYVTNEFVPIVDIFGPSQNGNVAPMATISGGLTTLVKPEGIAIAPPPTPTLTTTASASVTLGNTLFDTATLTGVSSPTGSLIFKLFGPADPTCSAAPAYTSPLSTVAGNGSYISPIFLPTAVGTYSWVVSYSGDANNGPASTSCGDPAETVTVTNPPLSVTGRGHQLRRKVTFNWMVAGGPQPIGFNILAVTQQHKLILMNSQLITSHTGAHYLLVVHHLHMKVDFDDFYVDVKTSGSFVKFGPFIVKG